MSKVKITGNASGTGTLTIAAPNTNTDRTLTLPDGAGEILLSDGDGSNLTGITTGKVLQVVNYGTYTETSTTSDTDTDLNITITPSSTSSKILVIALGYTGTASASCLALSRLYRDAAALGSFTKGFAFYYDQQVYPANIVYLDSPSTTSAITYKWRLQSSNGGTVYFNRTGNTNIRNTYSTITAMEIAG